MCFDILLIVSNLLMLNAKINTMKLVRGLFIVLLFSLIVSCDWIKSIIEPEPNNGSTNTSSKGDTLWIHRLPDDSLHILNPGNLYTAFALGENCVYYGAGGGTSTWLASRVYAVNRSDGTLKWVSNELDHFDISSQIVVGDDGTVYVIDFYKLYAIDPADGSSKWVWEVPETVPYPDYPNGIYTYGQIGALSLANNDNLILGSVGFGVYSRTLFCVDKNGLTKWYNVDAVGEGIGSNIVIGKNGNAFYYSRINAVNTLLAVNTETGAIVWKKEFAFIGGVANNIAVDGSGNLLCSFRDSGSNDYYLRIIDAGNGNELWKSDFLSSQHKKLIDPDGNYYHYLDKNVDKYGVYLINPYSNNISLINWGLNLGAIDNQKRVLLTFMDNEDYDKVKLGFFNADASIDWKVYVESIRNLDYLISNDKVIYGVVGEDQLIAIQGDASLASGAWSKLAHDNRNTSNCNKQ